MREELHAGRERAEADRLVPGHQVLRLIRIRQSEVQGTAHLLDGGRTELRRRDVLLDDLRLLVPPDVFEGALHVPEVQVEQADGRTQGDRVPHQRVWGEALRLLAEGNPQETHVAADLVWIRLRAVDVIDDRAALGDLPLVDIHRLLVQAHDDVWVDAMGQDRIEASPDLGPDMATADYTLIRRICPCVHPAPRTDLREALRSRRDAVSSGAANAKDKVSFGHPESHRVGRSVSRVLPINAVRI